MPFAYLPAGRQQDGKQLQNAKIAAVAAAQVVVAAVRVEFVVAAAEDEKQLRSAPAAVAVAVAAEFVAVVVVFAAAANAVSNLILCALARYCVVALMYSSKKELILI